MGGISFSRRVMGVDHSKATFHNHHGVTRVASPPTSTGPGGAMGHASAQDAWAGAARSQWEWAGATRNLPVASRIGRLVCAGGRESAIARAPAGMSLVLLQVRGLPRALCMPDMPRGHRAGHTQPWLFDAGGRRNAAARCRRDAAVSEAAAGSPLAPPRRHPCGIRCPRCHGATSLRRRAQVSLSSCGLISRVRPSLPTPLRARPL